MVKLFVIAVLATSLAVRPTLARDPMVVPTTGDSGLGLHDGGFDWDGFYTGIFGVATSSPAVGPELGIGLNVGFNSTFDFVLVGGEVTIQTAGSDIVGNSYLQAVGRGGVLVTDNLLLFGVGGVATHSGTGTDNHLLAGAGLEIGLTDTVSLRGQYLHGFPVTNSNPIEQVTIGAEFHF